DIAWEVYGKAVIQVDLNVVKGPEALFGHIKQTINKDMSLNSIEKKILCDYIDEQYDTHKVVNQLGERNKCEKCQEWTYAMKTCEHCIRKHFAKNFTNWTSDNSDIDEIIQTFQKNVVLPDMAIEWIYYEEFTNVKYLTKGGCASIFTAIWNSGRIVKWDAEKQQFKRGGRNEVILKRLENSTNPNERWLQEAKVHLNLMKTNTGTVRCYGMTKDPITQDFMLVLERMECNLREYLQQNFQYLTWKQRIKIIYDISESVYCIHKEDSVHRDLHSGNILRSMHTMQWFIGDLELKDLLYLLDECQHIQQFTTNITLEKVEKTVNNNQTSKIYNFQNLSKPKNSTEEEQTGDAYDSQMVYLTIGDGHLTIMAFILTNGPYL
ncbi:10711_t:CDS:2, partial [Dentiscutata heterogama]